MKHEDITCQEIIDLRVRISNLAKRGDMEAAHGMADEAVKRVLVRIAQGGEGIVELAAEAVGLFETDNGWWYA